MPNTLIAWAKKKYRPAFSQFAFSMSGVDLMVAKKNDSVAANAKTNALIANKWPNFSKE